MRTKKIQFGETRVITRFAFFPQKMNDGVTVWLEKYQAKQEYNEWVYIHDPSIQFTGWKNISKSVL